jgi:hypothetical protein
MSGTLTINSNLASLGAQRRLGKNTKALEQCYTRLSSGLRINRASDDAAGLAISESLNADTRVFAQGIRNPNDGIRLTNLAERALQEFSTITIHQRDLAFGAFRHCRKCNVCGNASGSDPVSTSLGDLNGDGILDIITGGILNAEMK